MPVVQPHLVVLKIIAPEEYSHTNRGKDNFLQIRAK